MKINQKLPQFTNERALIVLAGGLATEFYAARNGEIEKVYSFAVKTGSYSDQEGFFMKSGYGKVFGSGSVLKSLDQYTKQKFKKELREKFKQLVSERKINSLYIIAPRYKATDVLEAVGKTHAKKIKLMIYGEFTGRHPVKILERIQEGFDESAIGERVPARNETFRLLQKTEKVREIIGKNYPENF